MSKKIAIALSVFPGILFVGALISYIWCSIAERNLPKAGANIGLGILGLAFLINIPTIIAWGIFLVGKKKQPNNWVKTDLRAHGPQAAYP